MNFDFGDLRDCWKEAHPNDPGYTFDPINNSMAKLTSIKGIQRRLDRILMKSNAFKVKSMKLVGTQSFKIKGMNGKEVQIHPSDHYGLFAEIIIHE